MSAIVNDRDVLLQASALRFTPPADRALLLTASSPVFKALEAGGGVPAVITFTASLLNMAGDVVFSTNPATPLSVAGNVATLAFADMAGSSVAITASITRDGRTYQGSQTVVKLTDGPRGYSGDDGLRGSRQFYLSGYAAWSSTAATNAASVDGGPVYADAVTEFGSGFSQMRSWNGSSWIVVNQVIDGNLLVTGSVSSSAFYANTFSGYIFTGSIFRTAASGKRVIINDGGNNMLQVYSSSGLQMELGGSSGVIWADSGSTLTSTITGNCTGNLAGVVGQTTGSGHGVAGYGSNLGVGVFAHGYNLALKTDGKVTSVPYAESAGKGTHTNNCVPVTDNTYNLGTFALRWMGIVSATAVVVSSDARTKCEIADSDLGLDFIASLRPVSYKLIEGRKQISHAPEQAGPWPGGVPPEPEVIVTSIPGARRHYGLIAQEVRQVLGEKDVAFWTLEDPADPLSAQALRYEELIAPLIKAVQELRAVALAQQDEINLLKAA